MTGRKERDWLLIGAWTSLAAILAALVALAVLGP